MRLTLVFFAALAASQLVPAPARGAVEADTSRVVAGLQAWLDATNTLRADFQQSLISGALGTSGTESGELYLERPGKMRWDYRSPERKIAVLIGDRTSLYLEEDHQLIRGRLSPDQALFPRLLAGGEKVLSMFVPGLVATPSAGGKGSYRLRLVPKDAPQGVTEVTLVLQAASFSIKGAEVLDESGNRITYVFKDVVRNGTPLVGLFAFEPPPGTEVVDEP